MSCNSNLIDYKFDVMKYEDLCKYVFSEERVDWNLHNIKCKKREVVTARHICIYLGDWFFKGMTWEQLTEPFNQTHANGLSAKKRIVKLMASEGDLKRRINKYLVILRGRMDTSDRTTLLNTNPNYKDVEKSIMLESIDVKLNVAIENMKSIAEIYCEIRNMKLIPK